MWGGEISTAIGKSWHGETLYEPDVDGEANSAGSSKYADLGGVLSRDANGLLKMAC